MQIAGGIEWGAVAAVTSLVGIGVTAWVGAYNTGRFSQRIDDHDAQLARHDKEIERVGATVDEHGLALARLGRYDMADRKHVQGS
jgi:hypothetical protein